ncbi:MAG: hypothetical protein HYR55_14940 [Acidobacteria bacterium]|nr:hypothetical protein [Acidobacteriota bacterium]MBI3657034.1 hypothetical protein [Acidobacteriota bacterium]
MRRIGRIGLGLALLAASGLCVWAQRADSITVSADTVIPVNLNTFLSTKNAQNGDNFHAEVSLPITVENRVAIPKGAVVTGRVADVKRAGRVKGRAELALVFEKIIFPDGYTSEIKVELKGAHGRDFSKMKPGDEKIRGDTTKGKDAILIGQTTATGAIIGGAAGRGKGVAIGGPAGAIGGLVTVLATRGPDLVLERGTQLDLILKQPFIVERAR